MRGKVLLAKKLRKQPILAAEAPLATLRKAKGPNKGAFSSRVLLVIPARLEPVSRRLMNTAFAASYTFICSNYRQLRLSSQRVGPNQFTEPTITQKLL